MIKEKTNIAVFISGRGTNLKALILRSNKRSCNYKIVFVVSNKKNAAGLKIAKKNNFRKILKFFPKQYRPYIIGEIIKSKNKVRYTSNIRW